MGPSSRLRQFRALLRSRQIPLALVFDPQNICYLTGYWTILSGIPGTEALLVVPAQDEPWLAVPGLEVTLAREQCPEIKDLRYLRAAETHVGERRVPVQTVPQLVRYALAALPAGSVLGLDAPLLRTDRYQAIAATLEDYRVEDLTPGLILMRASKDAQERQLIRESAAIVTEAARAISRSLRPGVTENQLAAEAVSAIWSRGATITHLVVASGPRGAFPHALPTERVVEPGDFIVVDIGVLRGNYWAEIARTFVAGSPTAEQTRLLKLVARAQASARDSLRPGVRACDVDEAARAVLREAGFDDGIFIHSTGHGLGVMGPDVPAIAPHSMMPIPVDCTLTLEPGLYFPGHGGIRIEDSFFVSETSVECWTE